MALTEKQLKDIEKNFTKHLKQAQLDGLKEGSKAMLGFILKMCNEGKTIKDIRDFCKKSLKLKGMK